MYRDFLLFMLLRQKNLYIAYLHNVGNVIYINNKDDV